MRRQAVVFTTILGVVLSVVALTGKDKGIETTEGDSGEHLNSSTGKLTSTPSTKGNNKQDYRSKLAAFNRNLNRSLEAAEPNDSTIEKQHQELMTIELAKRAIRDTVVEAHYDGESPFMIEDVFEQQEVDPGWTEVVETAIKERIANYGAEGDSVKSVDCRTDICRIESEHSSVESVEEIYNIEEEGLPNEGSAMRADTTLEDGTIETVLYMGKLDAERDFHQAVQDEIYEMITGTSFDNIVPTSADIALVVAAYEGSGETFPEIAAF